MKKILIYLCILLTGIGWSCSDWLDVKPSDRISEENAFSSVAGFKNALNGIYVELNKDNLYGRRLTVDFVEILAKRYYVNSENDWAYDLMNYEYGGSTVKGYLQGIWGTAYKLIANTNLLIKNCDENREVLPNDYYGVCKGEALALRAMLHFDLFRLFGPVYSVDSLALSIPYYKEFSLEVAPQLSGTSFMDNVINDLIDAADLLGEYDPILTSGIQGAFDDYFLQNRNLRLNYYAVQGLLARAYLYKGDNENALIHATESTRKEVSPVSDGGNRATIMLYFTPTYDLIEVSNIAFALNVGYNHNSHAPGSVFVPGRFTTPPFSACMIADGDILESPIFCIDIASNDKQEEDNEDDADITNSFTVMSRGNHIYITSSEERIVRIYDSVGRMLCSIACKAGTTEVGPLDKGLYIVEGTKVYVER